MAKLKITRIDTRAFKQIKALTKSNKKVVMGVLGTGTYEDGTTVAEVALWNHYGTENIPARPFITATINEHKAAILVLEARIAKGIYEGKITEEKGLELIGTFLQNKIISKINDFFPPENAESTIAKKGSSKPLIDTKQLVGSITYLVRDSK